MTFRCTGIIQMINTGSVQILCRRCARGVVELEKCCPYIVQEGYNCCSGTEGAHAVRMLLVYEVYKRCSDVVQHLNRLIRYCVGVVHVFRYGLKRCAPDVPIPHNRHTAGEKCILPLKTSTNPVLHLHNIIVPYLTNKCTTLGQCLDFSA